MALSALLNIMVVLRGVRNGARVRLGVGVVLYIPHLRCTPTKSIRDIYAGELHTYVWATYFLIYYMLVSYIIQFYRAIFLREKISAQKRLAVLLAYKVPLPHPLMMLHPPSYHTKAANTSLMIYVPNFELLLHTDAKVPHVKECVGELPRGRLLKGGSGQPLDAFRK